MTTQEASIQTLPPHWEARFFTIWGGQAFSLLGSLLVQFALIWWLTKTTGSATVLATATLAAMLPQILLGPFAGALVDRFSRRWVMVIAYSVMALGTLVLAWLFWTGKVQVWHVYVILFIRAACGAFSWPAMQASTSLMVPEDDLSRVAGMIQALNGLISIVAPLAGAVLLSFMSTASIFIFDIFTTLLAIIPLLFIPVPRPAQAGTRTEHGKKSGVFEDVRAGLGYVRTWPGLLAVIILAMIVNFLLVPADALMPLLVTDHFGGGAIQFGAIESAWGFGVIAGGIVLRVWGGFRKNIVTSMLGLIGVGIGITLTGLAPAGMFGMAVLGYAVSGFMNPMINGPLFALLQKIVRPDMQGRVMALIMSGAVALTPLSLILAGPIADRLGIQVWFIVGGLVSILIGIGAFFIPTIMNVEGSNQDQSAAAEILVVTPTS